mgnify:CR=1 FL=1
MVDTRAYRRDPDTEKCLYITTVKSENSELKSGTKF